MLKTAGLCALCFATGIYLADDVTSWQALLHYEAQPGFYTRPYHLRIARLTLNGKVSTYLVDVKSGASQPIKEGLVVGTPKHQLQGLVREAEKSLKDWLKFLRK